MNRESKRVKGLFFMGTPFLTDFLGGFHAAKVHPLITMWLPEAVRILQVTRN